MLVLDLKCNAGHRFEGWFGSAQDFESQRGRKLVSCPQCGAHSVERIPSATRINVLSSEPPSQRAPEPARDVAAGGDGDARDPFAIAQSLYSRVVDEILSKTEDVGQEFPAEARRIFYEEAPARAIRGVATKDEHEALVEEGIPVARLPVPSGGSWN